MIITTITIIITVTITTTNRDETGRRGPANRPAQTGWRVTGRDVLATVGGRHGMVLCATLGHGLEDAYV
jgi:hypothetical protein